MRQDKQDSRKSETYFDCYLPLVKISEIKVGNLTCLVKVPLSSLPENAVSPGWCAALLTSVVIL